MLCYEISMLYYAMVYAVKDMVQLTVSLHPHIKVTVTNFNVEIIIKVHVKTFFNFNTSRPKITRLVT